MAAFDDHLFVTYLSTGLGEVMVDTEVESHIIYGSECHKLRGPFEPNV